LKGKVKTWLDSRGYGFIRPEKGDNDIFCHTTDVKNVYDLDRGDEVEFEVEETDKGKRAINVKIIH
jgi:CspA family cold shock protein